MYKRAFLAVQYQDRHAGDDVVVTCSGMTDVAWPPSIADLDEASLEIASKHAGHPVRCLATISLAWCSEVRE